MNMDNKYVIILIGKENLLVIQNVCVVDSDGCDDVKKCILTVYSEHIVKFGISKLENL